MGHLLDHLFYIERTYAKNSLTPNPLSRRRQERGLLTSSSVASGNQLRRQHTLLPAPRREGLGMRGF
jgi:hypothetical protein